MKKIFLIIILISLYLDASCDIKKSELKNCNFSGKNFENYNFSNKEMSNINFSGANMLGAIFSKTKMKNIKFNKANLFGAFFVEAKLNNIDFSNSDISGADFTGASISNTSFKIATQEDTIFGKMIIEKPDVIKVDSCQLIIQNNDKLTWYSTMLGLALDGLKKPSTFIIATLCNWHQGATFKLKDLSESSKTKDKFVFNYKNCTFPVYVWKESDMLHIQDHYNPTCVKSNSSILSSSSKETRNSCLANVKHDDSYCYAIDNQDMKNSCLANVEHTDSYCYAINNQDMKNSCLANVEHTNSYCYAINNQDMKNSCLANVEHTDSYCYAINNQDIKNSCLANVKHDDSYCYGIKN